ncbi:hypothetical protein LUZ63_017405 [Rhynchospora breviuscula]|uniref:Fungal lipase-type domain-containing protein n=1 Tax=Rhynchospora breviuscula TaxID=2022672 RepID=A0A9Q0C2E7_9POAL|nr:hypothetical protein LUZ63_017405 [Rhynchospora breviuscula]
MATAEAAVAAAGGAVLLYLALVCRLSHQDSSETEGRAEEEEEERSWPEMPPATWLEGLTLATRTVLFTCGETIGKWPIGDIAFGIKRQMKLQGSLQHEYAGSDSVQLSGCETLSELTELLRYLNLCLYFSKKPFPAFLEFGGYDQESILLHMPKAMLMKPAFTIVRDSNSKCFLLIIRGATTTIDRLTAASGAEVPFHHVILNEGKVEKLVLGHAHCGILAAARWIAQLAIPCLHEGLSRCPDYKVKVMGHSMGAGIGAILTHILREREEFSSCICFAFAPAACLTWELAESGKGFITSLVNRNDVVPSFSKVSAARIRSEVMAASWRNNVREGMRLNKLYNFVNGHVEKIRSHLASMSGVKVANSNVVVHCNGSSLSEPLIKSTANGTTNGTDALKINGNSDQVCSTFVAPQLETEEINTQQEQETFSNGEAAAELPENELHATQVGSRSRQFYPPGRIIHMVALPDGQTEDDQAFQIYETPRDLYGKIRLAPNMVKDHYMPSYLKTLEVLLDRLSQDCTDKTSPSSVNL